MLSSPTASPVWDSDSVPYSIGHDYSRQHCCTGHSHANSTPVYYLIPLMLMLRIWEGNSDTLWSLTEAQRELIIRESVPCLGILALTELKIWDLQWMWYIHSDSNECLAMQCTYSLHRITRFSLNKSISLETWWTYLVCPAILAAFQFPFLSLLSLLIAESSFFLSLSLSCFLKHALFVSAVSLYLYFLCFALTLTMTVACFHG